MSATAWILPLTKTLSVAVGEFELVHLLPEKPLWYKIPKTPAYCQQVIVWEQRIIPLMDLALRFGFTKTAVKANDDYLAAIIAYRAASTGLVGYGGLLLTTTPHRYQVTDKQACDLPTVFQTLAPYANACFTTKDNVVPTLRLNRLFLSQPDKVV